MSISLLSMSHVLGRGSDITGVHISLATIGSMKYRNALTTAIKGGKRPEGRLVESRRSVGPLNQNSRRVGVGT